MTDGEDSAGDRLFSRELAPSPRGLGRGLRLVVMGAVALGALGVWVWVHGSEEGALLAMSPAQRTVLFQEAWEDQRTRCLGGEGPRDTESRCRQRAEYLLRFPQCDEACRAELAPSLQGPGP